MAAEVERRGAADVVDGEVEGAEGGERGDDVGGVVVDGFVGAEAAHEGRVGGGAGRGDVGAEGVGDLDAEGAWCACGVSRCRVEMVEKREVRMEVSVEKEIRAEGVERRGRKYRCRHCRH